MLKMLSSVTDNVLLAVCMAVDNYVMHGMQITLKQLYMTCLQSKAQQVPTCLADTGMSCKQQGPMMSTACNIFKNLHAYFCA